VLRCSLFARSSGDNVMHRFTASEKSILSHFMSFDYLVIFDAVGSTILTCTCSCQLTPLMVFAPIRFIHLRASRCYV
jgi:hypothetical protein